MPNPSFLTAQETQILISFCKVRYLPLPHFLFLILTSSHRFFCSANDSAQKSSTVVVNLSSALPTPVSIPELCMRRNACFGGGLTFHLLLGCSPKKVTPCDPSSWCRACCLMGVPVVTASRSQWHFRPEFHILMLMALVTLPSGPLLCVTEILRTVSAPLLMSILLFCSGVFFHR